MDINTKKNERKKKRKRKEGTTPLVGVNPHACPIMGWSHYCCTKKLDNSSFQIFIVIK